MVFWQDNASNLTTFIEMYQNIEDILDFWFGYFPTEYSADTSKQDMWFKNGSAYDEAIFVKFGAIYHRAIEGGCENWQESQRGRLALIILLDQFSRHIYRNTAESFAQDEKAQAICIEGMISGHDQLLHPVERSFFYLPLEHAENLEHQTLSVKAYERLAEDVIPEFRKPFEMTLEFAKRHHHVIEKFGRFPELNDILGRESTEEEIVFMQLPEYSFL